MVLWLGRGGAHGLLAELLKSEYGLSPLPETAREESGKPFFPGRRALHFNLSHSGPLALCGVGAAPWGWTWRFCAPDGRGWPGTPSQRRNTTFFDNKGETGGLFIPSGLSRRPG